MRVLDSRGSSERAGRLKKLLVAVAAMSLAATLLGAGAIAGPTGKSKSVQRNVNDGVVDTALESSLQAEGLGPNQAGLPKSKENMKLVSKLRLTDTDGVISDVGYHKGYAYFGEWAAACPAEGEEYDVGVHVVNLKNMNEPKLVTKIPNAGNDWSGEGIHVIHLENKNFKGDVLLMSSEPCDSTSTEDVGGMSLWDVTKPAKPKMLIENFGDTTFGDMGGDPTPTHSVHSVMGWVDGKKAFAVQVDNKEFPDVDIFDISDPANPVIIAETGLTSSLKPV